MGTFKRKIRVNLSLSTDVLEDLFISPFNTTISHSEMVVLNGSAMGEKQGMNQLPWH
jgi:hypothetical protein